MKRENLTSLPKDVQNFLRQISILNKSELTIYEYACDLRLFFRFLKQNKNPELKSVDLSDIAINDIDSEFIKSIDFGDIVSFLSYCAMDRMDTAKTRARKATSLRQFFKYLEKEKIISENPLLGREHDISPKIEKTLPKFLTLEQSRMLLNCVSGQNYERDYCILTLFLNCGLRLSELVGLNIENISDDGKMTVMGKGKKQRIVYINDSCQKALKKYLSVRPNDNVIDKNALFLSRNRRRISRRTVQNIVSCNLDKAGLSSQGLSTHKLRHTAATLMYQYGDVDVMILKEILGHENLSTTEIYTHVSNEQIKSSMFKNPLNDTSESKDDE